MRLTFNYTPANIPDGSSRCANISNILFFFNFLVIDLFLNLSFYIIDSSVLVFWDYQDYLLFQNAFIWNIEPEFSSINSSEVISDQRPLLTMLLFFLIQKFKDWLFQPTFRKSCPSSRTSRKKVIICLNPIDQGIFFPSHYIYILFIEYGISRFLYTHIWHHKSLSSTFF